MTGGINDTAIMKEKFGAQLTKARNSAGMDSWYQLSEKLSNSSNIPTINNEKKKISKETLKKWGTGENPVNVEWLPALCEALDCDIGFLFGEYEERRRVISDACQITGLSEGAVNKLNRFAGENYKIGCSDVLSSIIEDDNFTFLINLICGYFDISDNENVHIESGLARVAPTKSDLTKFIIQEYFFDLLSRAKLAYLSKFDTVTERLDILMDEKLKAMDKERAEEQ